MALHHHPRNLRPPWLPVVAEARVLVGEQLQSQLVEQPISPPSPLLRLQQPSSSFSPLLS